MSGWGFSSVLGQSPSQSLQASLRPPVGPAHEAVSSVFAVGDLDESMGILLEMSFDEKCLYYPPCGRPMAARSGLFPRQRPPGGRVRITAGVRSGSLPRGPPPASGCHGSPRSRARGRPGPRLYIRGCACVCPCVHRRVCMCACAHPHPVSAHVHADGSCSHRAVPGEPRGAHPAPGAPPGGESQSEGVTWTPQPPAGGRKGPPARAFATSRPAGRRRPAHLGAPTSSLSVLGNTK